ncbi:ABC transporter ATP-binding protein [Nocardia sp. A7]|uniref:ABC transporter ATP-binding protein n=1 Tax=Nocardia sp. A7 TaxID=2789274 RepID=UPI00397CBD1F
MPDIESSQQPMLELTGVVKQYHVGDQEVRALDEVSLRIEAGQFTSIIGPSGSGKSTLLHLLGALDRPDAGSIRFRGTEIGDLNEDKQAAFRLEQVGFVFQFFNLLPTLTAWENVAVPKLLDGTGLRKAKPRALELLDLVGLGDRAQHRPAELSGGQMQRVAVARALIMDPPLILADEPTGNLDSKTGAAILALLGDITAQGNSVVMVTHDSNSIDYCDRVITLRDGQIGADELAGARVDA